MFVVCNNIYFINKVGMYKKLKHVLTKQYYVFTFSYLCYYLSLFKSKDEF